MCYFVHAKRSLWQWCLTACCEWCLTACCEWCLPACCGGFLKNWYITKRATHFAHCALSVKEPSHADRSTMFLSHDMSRATSQGHDSKVMDLSNTLGLYRWFVYFSNCDIWCLKDLKPIYTHIVDSLWWPKNTAGLIKSLSCLDGIPKARN